MLESVNYKAVIAAGLWKELADKAVTQDELLGETFLFFSIGTDLPAVWSWFEETFDVPLNQLMYEQPYAEAGVRFGWAELIPSMVSKYSVPVDDNDEPYLHELRTDAITTLEEDGDEEAEIAPVIVIGKTVYLLDMHRGFEPFDSFEFTI